MRAVSTLGSVREFERGGLADSAFIALITLLSALPFVGRFGFYSDDWGILAAFALNPHQSLLEGFAGRPVQALYSALLFRSFGLDPLGYHLVDTAVLSGCAALLHLLLLRLRLGRAQSFAATFLFIMLPQLSTIRVWFASFQVPLSLAMMLASMHCQLSYARSRKAAWLAGAVVGGLLSIAAYEIFAPLLAGFAIALVLAAWRNSREWWPIVAGIAVVGLLALAALYKVVSSGRAGPVMDPQRYLLGIHQLFRLDYDWHLDSGLNLIATPRAYFAAPVIGLWSGAKELVSGRAGVVEAAVAIAIAVIAFWRLRGAEQRYAAKPLLLVGVAAFLLGNATFLVVPAVVFTSTGVDNRVQVGGAIGVAMIFVALLCFAMNLAPVRSRAVAFATMVALIGALAFARVAQIERYWAEAPALQRQVVIAARADLRNVPAGSAIILDGICPYHGPAIVFETSWDIGGALTLALGRPVNGDAVSPRMSPTSTGLSTSIYKVPSFYRYARNLYVYNPMRHSLVLLDSATAATRYFASRAPRACPGYVARGVEV